jgi:predicted tellurium resistance membrane protein TerC
VGLIRAMFTRLTLLVSIIWVVSLIVPWFSVFGQEISGRDIILIAGCFDVYVPKSYIYFAMAFSVGVEMLNLRMRTKQMKPVKLHKKVFSS